MTAVVSQIPLREEIAKKDTWDTEVLYSNMDSWRESLQKTKESPDAPYWPSLSQKHYKETDPKSVHSLLKQLFHINRELEKLYIYAHLLHDQDLGSAENIAAFQEISLLYNNFNQETSWITPTLTFLSEKDMEILRKSSELSEYSFFLEKIFRKKPHTGTKNEEAILASSHTALGAVNRAFSSLSDSEIPFTTVKNSKGEELPLSHGLAKLYAHSPDRELRKNSYTASKLRYEDYKDTFSELLYGKVSAHVFFAKNRKYSSCLEASLFQNNIPISVYHNLITECKKNTHLVKRYFDLKRRLLKIEDMKVYDIYAPILPINDEAPILTYDEAVALVVASMKPLGHEYTEKLEKGLTTDRWVDKYENKSKRSGAYSSGSYDTFPYILLNFKGSNNDCSTLAHEAGHSMHSLLSRSNQAYHNADYPLFLAEIASTFNEILLTKHLTDTSESIEQKIRFISEQLDTIFATLFRQTMFADFELRIHSLAEEDKPLNAATLNETYKQVLKIYLGDALSSTEEAEIEWARIPHFYYNFYVYQYATGISAALTFADKVVRNEPGAVDNYLLFLKSGGSKFPIDILKDAGIDMTQPGVLSDAMRFIEAQITLLEKLLDS